MQSSASSNDQSRQQLSRRAFQSFGASVWLNLEKLDLKILEFFNKIPTSKVIRLGGALLCP
jgi:hypothetical protein